jgi:hypothetical protein
MLKNNAMNSISRSKMTGGNMFVFLPSGNKFASAAVHANRKKTDKSLKRWEKKNVLDL